jgi:hypothetical protein
LKPITNTFVLVAPDCPVTAAVVPTAKGDTPAVAVVQYELLTAKPYSLTLEDLIFETHIRRTGIPKAEAKARAAAIRAELFAKPHPCMRASPLPKRYGWGVHHDAAGHIALVAVESEEYRRFAAGKKGMELVFAMRSKRAG